MALQSKSITVRNLINILATIIIQFMTDMTPIEAFHMATSSALVTLACVGNFPWYTWSYVTLH